MNFIFLKNKIKVCLKNLKKNHFLNLVSLCDDMENDLICLFLLGLTNVFSVTFYFIHQICSFCMISIFIINTKINFSILLSK